MTSKPDAPAVQSWSKEQINIGLAKRAWSFMYVHSSLRDRRLGGGDQVLFDLLADDVEWSHEGPRDPRIPTYPGEIHGKQALIDMVKWESGVIMDLDIEDPVAGSLEFIGSGDRVVILEEDRYSIKTSGVTVRHLFSAVIMDFRDGLIARIRIIGNLADYIESCLGVGWSAQLRSEP